MKNSILLLLFSISIFSNNVFAQNSQQIKSASIHEIITHIQSELLEKGYDNQKAFILRDSLGKKMVKQFQLDYQEVMTRVQGGCCSPETVKKYEEKLGKLQNQILFFEKETQRILEESQLERSQNILLFTKNKIQEFGAKNKVLIMSTDVILFQNDEKSDITSTLLKHIHQSKEYNDWIKSFNDTEQLIQQIQDLNFEIQPMFIIKNE